MSLPDSPLRQALQERIDFYVIEHGHGPIAATIDEWQAEIEQQLNSPAGFSCRAENGAERGRKSLPQSFHLPER